MDNALDRPLLVIPCSRVVAHMLDAAPLAASARARDIGIVVLMPRHTHASDLFAACFFWPKILNEAGVARVAVVLHVEAYARAEPLLPNSRQRMKDLGVAVRYFHEGHLESDQIRAWFEQRRPRRRVTSDTLIKLSHRYAIRGDFRSARHARQLAEAAA
jgi:hypothetical protein